MKRGTAVGTGIVLLVLVLGIGIGLPYYAGLQTEKHFRESIEAVVSDSPVTVKDYTYTRGLLGAKASSSLEIRSASGTVVLPVEHEIEHGLTPMNPNFVRVVSTVHLPEGAPEAVKAFFKDQPPMKITTIVGTDKGMRSEIGSPTFDGALPGNDQDEIHWKGISGTVNLTPDWNHGTFKIVAPAFSIRDQEGKQFSLDSCEVTGDMHRPDASAIWQGVSQLTLKSLHFQESKEGESAPETAGADNFHLTAEVNEKDGMVGASYTVLLDKLTAGGKSYDKAALELKFANLDSASLITLRDNIREINKQDVDDRTRSTLILQKMLEQLPKFLSRAPEVSITHLSLQTKDGAVQGDGRLKYIGGQDIQAFQPLRDLEGEAKLTMPKPLVQTIGSAIISIGGKDVDAALGEKADEMKHQLVQSRLDGLVQSGVIEDKGDAYAAQVALKGGVVNLNGKQLDMPSGS